MGVGVDQTLTTSLHSKELKRRQKHPTVRALTALKIRNAWGMTNCVQTLDSENHDLRWEAIRLHGLLASVHAPNSGRGVLLWTSRLTSCFESSPEFSEWLKESQKLRSLLLLQAFDTQEPVVQRELDDPIWTSVDNCMSAREAATRGHFWVDKLLAHGMTHIAAGLHYATAEFFNGMRMLYRSTRLNPKGTRGSQWSDVLNALTLQGPPLPLLIHRLPSGHPEILHSGQTGC